METNDEKKARVTFEQPEKYECDHKGNLDACANERCWDLQECQDSRYRQQPEAAGQEQETIVDAMFRAQFGTRSDSRFVEEHMKEYFQRWPNYKDKFTHLEWYHIFLDVVEKHNKYLTRKP